MLVQVAYAISRMKDSKKSIKIDKTQPFTEISLKEMIDCIGRAGYVVEKKLTKGADMASKG